MLFTFAKQKEENDEGGRKKKFLEERNVTFDWVLLGCVLFLSWATAYFVPMRLACMRR